MAVKTGDKGKRHKKAVREPAPWIVNDRFLKIYQIVLLIGLCVLLFYPPYLRGLFFDDELLPTHIYSFALFLIFLGYKFIRKDYAIFKSKLDYAALGMVVAFFLPVLLGQAVNVRAAVGELLRYLNLFAVYVMVRDLVDGEKKFRIVLNVMAASAVGVALFGIDAAAGEHVQKFIGGLLHYKFFGGYVGGRINSTLQYPNTLASYLMATYFIALGLQLESKKLWQKAVYGGAGFILFFTFLLTYSRGAWLQFPIMYVIFLFMLFDIYKVAGAVLISAGTFLVSFALLQPAAGYISGGAVQKIWLLILAGSLVTAALNMASKFIITALEKVNKRTVTTAGISILSAVILLMAAVIIVAFNVEAPLELKHDAGEQNSSKAVSRIISNIEPDTQYNLSMKLESTTANPKQWACNIIIYSLNGEGGNQTQLESKVFYNESGYISVPFNTNEDTQSVRVVVHNYYSDSYLNIEDVKLQYAEGKARKIILKYKYIPETLIGRFESLFINDESSFQRMAYYTDGLKIVREHLLFGAGGKAWEALYMKYQSFPYTSTQAHNYFLQTFIETGIIGLLLLAAFIIAILKVSMTAIRKSTSSTVLKGLGIAAVSLAVHSIIDFDFSLFAVLLMVWTIIGLFGAANVNMQEHARASLKVRKAEVISVPLICIAALILAISFNGGLAYAKKAVEAVKAKDMASARKYYEKSASMDFLKSSYKADLAQVYDAASRKIENGKTVIADRQLFDKAEKLYLSALSLDRYNPRLNALMGALYMGRGEIEKGLQYVDKSVECQPMKSIAYEQKADAYFKTGLYYYNKNEKEKAKEMFNKVGDIVPYLSNLNKTTKKPVKPTDGFIKIVEKNRYIIDNYDVPEKIREFNRLVYNSGFSMDTDNDSVPDDWIKGPNIKTGILNGFLQVENTGKTRSYLTSKDIKLNKNSSYSIKVSAKGTIESFTIGVVSRKGKEMQFSSQNIKPEAEFAEYAFDFTTTNDIEEGSQYVIIYLNGEDSEYLQIDNIAILKEI